MIRDRTIDELIVDLGIAYANKLIVGFVQNTTINASKYNPTLVIRFIEKTPETTRHKVKEFIEATYTQVRKAHFVTRDTLFIEYAAK